MDILDMSVTTSKGNRYIMVMVDCFSKWTEACPLPNKTALEAKGWSSMSDVDPVSRAPTSGDDTGQSGRKH